MTVATEAVATAVQPPKKGVLWAGRVLSALPALMFIMSAVMKLTRQPQVLETLGKWGFTEGATVGIGALELACVVVYAIPQTALLGAVLLSGYIGGAVATHVRAGDGDYVLPIVLGIVVWVGLYLRDERLRALMPLRRL